MVGTLRFAHPTNYDVGETVDSIFKQPCSRDVASLIRATNEYDCAFSRRVAPEVCIFVCPLWRTEQLGC